MFWWSPEWLFQVFLFIVIIAFFINVVSEVKGVIFLIKKNKINVPCKLYPNIKHALTSSSNHSLPEDNNNKSEISFRLFNFLLQILQAAEELDIFHQYIPRLTYSLLLSLGPTLSLWFDLFSSWNIVLNELSDNVTDCQCICFEISNQIQSAFQWIETK